MARPGAEVETALCEPLDWDSGHFGFPIARVTGKVLTPKATEAIDEWCRDSGVRCLYYLADAADADSARVAARHGFRVVDVRITLRHSLEELADLPDPAPGLLIREAELDDLGDLRRLAARSHHGSRFYSDGQFPHDRCDALYEAWVERGFHDSRRRLIAAMLEGEPAGYGLNGPIGAEAEGFGELTAVDVRHRGKGIASGLCVANLRLSAARGAVTHLTVRSAHNVAIARLHERLGYRTEKVEIWHHKWYA